MITPRYWTIEKEGVPVTRFDTPGNRPVNPDLVESDGLEVAELDSRDELQALTLGGPALTDREERLARVPD